MKTENITKGKCVLSKSLIQTNKYTITGKYNSGTKSFKILTIEDYTDNPTEADANAELIAEAFNIANETGKSPRTLADENKELLEALTKLYSSIDSCVDITPELLLKCNQTIQKVTGK